MTISLTAGIQMVNSKDIDLLTIKMLDFVGQLDASINERKSNVKWQYPHSKMAEKGQFALDKLKRSFKVEN